MKRTAILTAVLLLGSAFAFAGAANAEDVQECQSSDDTPAGPVRACVEDTSEGDEDEACSEEGSGSYNGRTGGSVRAGGIQAPYAQADAGGAKDC
jgi:hypothetical protein